MTRALRTGSLPLLVLIASTIPARGGAVGSLHFEQVGSESGPPCEVVTVLYQDRAGFVWIGSRDGLTLYDGHSFTIFEHDASDPSSISDDAIRAIYEDGRGNLWVGTNTGGLNRFDRAAWKFERFRHDSADPHSLSHDSVYAIVEDREGSLWVGTQRGLNRFNPDSRTFERFLANPGSAGTLSHDYVTSLLVDTGGRLRIGTRGGGLDVYDPGSGTFRNFRHDEHDPRSLSHDYVFALLDDAAGNLWIGTNAGLDRMDTATGAFQHLPHDPNGPAGPGDVIVTSLVPGPEGRIWVGTWGGGLKALHPATGTFRVFHPEPDRRGSLPSERVTSLLTDHAGALWVGTWGGGLNRVTGSAILLVAGADEIVRPSDLEDADVTSLARDGEGGLWLGTRDGTLLRKDPRVDTYRRYLGDKARSIVRILPARDGHVWVGTSNGLVLVDPRAGRVAEFEHRPTDPTSLGPGYVAAVLEDRDGRLWVGTGEGGLQRVGPDGRVLQRFLNDPTDPSSLPGLSGLEVGKRAAEESPRTRVIILSMHADATYVRQALRAGFSGYLLKGAAVAELPLALQSVMRGETYLTPRISRTIVEGFLRDGQGDPGPLDALTGRQREILQLIAEGRSTKEIAQALDLSVKTVETHRMRIMERLDIHDVPGLVRFAIRAGLISQHE